MTSISKNHFDSIVFWVNTAPRPVSLMSVYIRNGKMGGELKLDFSWSKACCLASFQMKGLPFFTRSFKG